MAKCAICGIQEPRSGLIRGLCPLCQRLVDMLDQHEQYCYELGSLQGLEAYIKSRAFLLEHKRKILNGPKYSEGNRDCKGE